MTRKTYAGVGVAVSFDPDVCTHSTRCWRELPAVFEVKRRPWIMPDAASPQAVADQVARCPSGALRIEAG